MPISNPVFLAEDFDIGSGTNNVSDGANSLQAELSAAVNAGLTLISALGVRTRGPDVVSGEAVSDDLGSPNAFTIDASGNNEDGTNNPVNAALARLSKNDALAGTNSIDAAWTDTEIFSSVMAAVSVDGLDLSSPLDGAAAAAGGESATPNSGNITPSAGERLLMGWLVISRLSGVINDDPNFTVLREVEANAGFAPQNTTLQLVYRKVTADGSTAYSFAPGLDNAATEWRCGIQAYKAAVAPGGSTVPAKQNSYRQRRAA